MDCLNRNSVMVWGKELLTDLWGWGTVLNGVFSACLILLVSHRGVQNVVCVSHTPLLLIC